MSSILDFFKDPAIAGLLGPLIGGAIGAVGGYLGAKISKPHDLQVALNGTVAELIKGFEAQLDAARSEQKEARQQIDGLSAKVDRQAHEIFVLNAHIVELTATLREHGISAPPHPFGDGQLALNFGEASA